METAAAADVGVESVMIAAVTSFLEVAPTDRPFLVREYLLNGDKYLDLETPRRQRTMLEKLHALATRCYAAVRRWFVK
jgi:hypothetical protein